jgi:GT2 family glycosyltransferase
MKYPRVSIIVLNWNNYKDTKECIESLSGITYPNYEIIVVDNGSVDGSTRKIQEEFSKLEYIYNKDNLGFAGGNNIGMRYALNKGSDFIMILNNDTTVKENFLEPLVEDLTKNEKIGMAGPLIYYFYEPYKIFSDGEKLAFWRKNLKELLRGEKIRMIQGCCMLIKKEVIEKIGYFYEPYFLNWEEVDYCLQTNRAGYEVICEHKSVIWHKVRTTLKKNPASESYYFYRNRLLFTKRTAPFLFKYFFYAYYSLYLFYRFVRNYLEGEKNIAKSAKDALFDFWAGNFGKWNQAEKIKL